MLRAPRSMLYHMHKKLFVGIPVAQQMPVGFVQSLLALQKNKPCPIEIGIAQGDGVARSRNMLSAQFLASDCTHLLFLDSDLIFSPEHVSRLLSHDLPLVGGFYPKKQEGSVEWVVNTLNPQPEPNQFGLQRVRYLGTGFLLIARRVFETMSDKYPAIKYRADYGARRDEHDFWPMGIYEYPDGHRRYLSEDWFFCQRWLDLGGDVIADTLVILKHIGPAVFPLITQQAEIFAQQPKQSGASLDPTLPASRGDGACMSPSPRTLKIWNDTLTQIGKDALPQVPDHSPSQSPALQPA